jgi:hypothetical protein
MNDWLDRFRDDPREPRRPREPARDPQRPREPVRDMRPPREPAPPGWLDRSGDDPRQRKPQPEAPRPSSQKPLQQKPPQPKQPQRPPASLRPPQSAQARPRTPPFWPAFFAAAGRPQGIVLFAMLMAVSLVLGLTATAIAYPRLAPHASAAEILLPDVIVIALTAGFVYLVAGMRQGWAVWVLAIFCAVRFLLYVPTFLHIDVVTVRMLTACYFILQGAAFWFAFTPEARRWLGAGKT